MRNRIAAAVLAFSAAAGGAAIATAPAVAPAVVASGHAHPSVFYNG